MDYPVESFTDDERALLAPHFTNLDRPVFALVNLPETVKGALFARYSRYQGTLRRLYLDEFAADAEPGPAFDGAGGRARAQALRAHLHRLRRRLGGAARRRAHRLRVGLERDDEAAPARPAGRLPRAVDPLHGLRRADGRRPRLPLLARTRRSARSTSGDGLAVRRLLRGAAARRGVGGRALPARPTTSPRPRTRARSGRRRSTSCAACCRRRRCRTWGSSPRARPTSSCCCACSPRRCPRRATTRP